MAELHGILLLDKPSGSSSNHTLQKVKRLLGAEKAGHTGSLDPLATGMLPICLGDATKIAGYLLGAHKAYRTTVQLGVTTITGDADGDVLERTAVPWFDVARAAEVVARFVGRITQRPPVYSAIKRGGEPLYKLARRGESVEAPLRQVDVFRIDLLGCGADRIELEVECGSGTYIRSLAVDIGAALGCGAHVAALRRLWVDPFHHEPMVTAEQLQETWAAGGTLPLLTMERGMAVLPRVDLSADDAFAIRQGRPVFSSAHAGLGMCHALDPNGRLVAVAECGPDGRVRSRRVFGSF